MIRPPHPPLTDLFAHHPLLPHCLSPFAICLASQPVAEPVPAICRRSFIRTYASLFDLLSQLRKCHTAAHPKLSSITTTYKYASKSRRSSPTPFRQQKSQRSRNHKEFFAREDSAASNVPPAEELKRPQSQRVLRQRGIHHHQRNCPRHPLVPCQLIRAPSLAFVALAAVASRC